MHGGGKSDEAIVAVKPANAAEQSAAELVEPRAEAKGNAARQSTYRTQRRVDVSPAPDRIRHRARGVSFGPEVGAVCGKAARTVLCGGRTAMSVPTASEASLAAVAARPRRPDKSWTAWARREERAFAHPTADWGPAGGPGMQSFDGVVIGAGHNGLTLASYLSRAGLKVAVLERNPRIGGGCTTDEPTLPGYRFNLHSNFFMGFRHSPLIRDLELHRFGFSYIEPPVQQGAAFRDGTCVVIHKDLDKSCASLARFSQRDAETFRELHHRYSVGMRPLFTSLAFNAPLPLDALRDRLSGPQAKEFLSHAQHDLFSVVRKHFDDDRIRTLFTSYMHVITTESVPGAGIVFPLIFANVMEFTLPVGGSASFTSALRRVIEACGGAVVTDADVEEIVVKNGRATAVRLSNGDTIEG